MGIPQAFALHFGMVSRISSSTGSGVRRQDADIALTRIGVSRSSLLIYLVFFALDELLTRSSVSNCRQLIGKSTNWLVRI